MIMSDFLHRFRLPLALLALLALLITLIALGAVCCSAAATWKARQTPW
jgi:hypothetical protein